MGAISGVVPLLLVVTVTCIVMLLCVRHRKRKTPQPTENVAYHIHDDEIKTGANEAYGTVDSDVVATTNPAYATTSGSGISTSNNSAYARAPTTGCQSEDIIDTSTNVAYLPTTIFTSDNPAYATTSVPSNGCQSEDIIDTSTNVAYLPTTISTSDNPAYGPVEDNRGNTLTYDYVAARQGYH